MDTAGHDAWRAELAVHEAALEISPQSVARLRSLSEGSDTDLEALRSIVVWGVASMPLRTVDGLRLFSRLVERVADLAEFATSPGEGPKYVARLRSVSRGSDTDLEAIRSLVVWVVANMPLRTVGGQRLFARLVERMADLEEYAAEHVAMRVGEIKARLGHDN